MITNPSTTHFVQDLIHKHAVRSPDSTAFIFEEKEITYQELNLLTNQLGNYLQGQGVQQGTLIGICMDRSLEMVIGILGAIKAGGAFIPLDPSYPPDRLSNILDDSGAQFVLAHSNLIGTIRQTGKRIFCLDEEWHNISQQPTDTPEIVITPDNLAYVIYTSGSTGRPKGVMVSHANLSSFVQISSTVLDVNRDDIYLHSASIAYALSIRQLMVPLSYGATIVLATGDQVYDPLSLFSLIKRQNVSLMDMVPSFWRICIHRLSDLSRSEREILLDNSLRRIVSVGEPLLFDIPRDWRLKLGHPADLVNIFGQTETTGVVATYKILDEELQNAGTVPIGKSIQGTKIYILNPDLQPVADGEVGELCVSNPCLARGYLNQPQSTAEKFILNPFDRNFGEILYRTGDLARYNENGDIVFLGREDFQVKIRGQRLELGEIESILLTNPDVGNCVVVARGENPDQKYLVAYIVLNKTLNPSELRRYLQERVPDYMVPSSFVFLDDLPLTPNGKIDRLALPDPSLVNYPGRLDQTIQDDLKEQSPPRNHEEKVLLQAWQYILEYPNIGIHDNFFDLGGHSLAVVRLFSQIERELCVRLSINTILQAPTIAQLAVMVQNNQDSSDFQVLFPIQKGAELPPFFCVHGIGGGILGYRDLARELNEEQPFWGLQAVGQDNHEICDLTIEAMASRYIDVIREYQPNGPYRLGGYCFGGVVAYEMAVQLDQIGEQVSLLAVFEGYIPGRQSTNAPISQRLGSIFKYIPIWVNDYAGMNREELNQRIRSTLNKLRVKSRRQPEFAQRVRIEEILETDLAMVPDRNIEMTQLHSHAFRSYKPRKYSGVLTLFRARHRSFNEIVFGSLDPKMGWGGLAIGGVNVVMVDGFHRNIHLPPYVKSLGTELDKCLGSENQVGK